MKIKGTIIKNENSGIFTAFINQYPGIMAQGNSIEKVKQKLDKNFDNFIDFMKKKEIDYSETHFASND